MGFGQGMDDAVNGCVTGLLSGVPGNSTLRIDLERETDFTSDEVRKWAWEVGGGGAYALVFINETTSFCTS